jgi:hypothetical protein
VSARRVLGRYHVPVVRLSRDGQWAVCARVECGTRFAQRIDLTPKREAELERRYLRQKDPRPRTLAFLPGWVNKEAWNLGNGQLAGWLSPASAGLIPGGVWRMSERARDQISKGERPFRRRSPRRSLSKTAYAYPALVICPACHQAQVADEGVLGLR